MKTTCRVRWGRFGHGAPPAKSNLPPYGAMTLAILTLQYSSTLVVLWHVNFERLRLLRNYLFEKIHKQSCSYKFQ